MCLLCKLHLLKALQICRAFPFPKQNSYFSPLHTQGWKQGSLVLLRTQFKDHLNIAAIKQLLQNVLLIKATLVQKPLSYFARHCFLFFIFHLGGRGEKNEICNVASFF